MNIKKVKNGKFMFTDKEKVLLKNLKSEKNDETGFMEYSAEISEDLEVFKQMDIGFLPQALKTRLTNMKLKKGDVVFIQYKGLKDSPNSDHQYHAFYVEKK
jgi:hypothetical protein